MRAAVAIAFISGGETPPAPPADRDHSLPFASLVIAILYALFAPGVCAQSRIDGVAAFVGGTAPGPGTVVILRSDVALRARLALARESETAALGALPDALLAASLDEIIGEVLIEREADRLRAARPSDGEVARERERMEVEAGGAERLASILRFVGASTAELDAIARRRTYVAAFLHASLEGTTMVSDTQVERAYAAGEHPFTRRPLSDVRELLRAWIAQRTLRNEVARWVAVLRSRTTVRVLAEWRRGEAHGD